MRKYLNTILVASGLIAALAVAPAWADDTAQLKEQVQALQNRVDQLESELANKQVAASAPAYDQWNDPFMQMMLMRQQMDNTMHQAFGGTEAFNPSMDMTHTDRQYIITMDIPGMDKNKIDVEAKDGVLTVSGERRSEVDNNGNQYYRQERTFGTFMQAVPLPEDANTNRIEAKYKDGVLTVTIDRKKKEEKRPMGQKITVR